MSYLAYQDWMKRHGPEPNLPESQYSQAQLFWIQAAITQCAKHNPQNEFSDEVDSPLKFRVTSVFANRPEFSRDFNCPLGSNMNPVKKCSVW
ncbi:neprilysin-2-like [Belonocnema kinseyi]|uniref:neprilysin-2-like n=1 Tax=Belonocnema kinseyi TaxID=2817044 RepID=UPI00143DB29F|nr:neprilysin-2-like [Belonocnema kinseyi]